MNSKISVFVHNNFSFARPWRTQDGGSLGEGDELARESYVGQIQDMLMLKICSLAV